MFSHGTLSGTLCEHTTMQVKTVLSNKLSISWSPMQFYWLAEILQAQLDNSELQYGEMKVWLCDIWDWPPFLICVTHMELQIRHQVFRSRLLSVYFSRRCNSCTVMGSEVSAESSHIEPVPTKYRERQGRSASQRKNSAISRSCLFCWPSVASFQSRSMLGPQ